MGTFGDTCPLCDARVDTATLLTHLAVEGCSAIPDNGGAVVALPHLNVGELAVLGLSIAARAQTLTPIRDAASAPGVREPLGRHLQVLNSLQTAVMEAIYQAAVQTKGRADALEDLLGEYEARHGAITEAELAAAFPSAKEGDDEP